MSARFPTEICLALAASTALHAGLLIGVPASGGKHDSAAPVAVAPAVISARLKDTFAARKGQRSRRADSTASGRAPRAASKRQARIDNAQRFYPPEAVARGLEGETILMLRYGADGALIGAWVAKSSGHAILDEAALRAIRAAPPASGPREMLFPVTFTLH